MWAGGPADDLPVAPGLEVTGVGRITLPLIDARARALAAGAEQAPHGEGRGTELDTATRNTLQVDPSKVPFRDPVCETAVDERAWRASYGISKLKDALGGLDMEDSVVVLPLSRQYETPSLRRGTGCLKGADRERFEALDAASAGTYAFYTAVVSRTDMECGAGTNSFDFEAVEIEVGDVSIDSACGVDGSPSPSSLADLHIDWESCEEGGAVLGSNEEVEAMWGEGVGEVVEGTGDECATHEVAYHAYVLLGYRRDAELELMMKSNADVGVNRFVPGAGYIEMSRIIAYLHSHISCRLTTATIAKLVTALGGLYPRVDEVSKDDVVDMLESVLRYQWPMAIDCHFGVVLSDGLVDAVVGAVKTCGWYPLQFVVVELVGLVRTDLGPSKSIARRAELVAHIQGYSGAEGLVATLAADVLAALEIPLVDHPRGAARGDVLTRRSAEVLFRAGDLARFVRWAEHATEPELATARAVLPDRLTGAAADARDRIVELYRGARLVVLRRRWKQLEAATRDGEPVFTWAMPQVSCDPRFFVFLESLEEGPSTVCVGGGINNARRISAALRDLPYASLAAGETRRDLLLRKGYSVTTCESGIGARAAVTVTKTREYHDALVVRFRKDAKELAEVRAEIAMLRGGAATGGPVPKRRRRTDAAPPEGTDAVAIE